MITQDRFASWHRCDGAWRPGIPITNPVPVVEGGEEWGVGGSDAYEKETRGGRFPGFPGGRFPDRDHM